jgi:hypothetical protein
MRLPRLDHYRMRLLRATLPSIDEEMRQLFGGASMPRRESIRLMRLHKRHRVAWLLGEVEF